MLNHASENGFPYLVYRVSFPGRIFTIGGEEERLPENTFRDENLMNTTGANARMVVIEKPEGKAAPVEETNDAPAWHTALPSEGLPLTPEQEKNKVGAYERVPGLVRLAKHEIDVFALQLAQITSVFCTEA